MSDDLAPDVSVVVAAYNCAAFVDRAIASALAQQGIRVEIVIVDDASTDGTAETIGRMVGNEARIRLLRLEQNGGPSAARNAGFAAARGTWIAVLDADDSFEPGRLERLAGLGTEYDADMIADNFRYYDARTGLVGPAGLREAHEPELIDRYGFMRGARPYAADADFGLLKPLFRRKFIEEHRLRYPLDARHGEDFLLYAEIMLLGARLVLSRIPGYLYTTRGSGFSRTTIDYEGQLRHLSGLRARPEVASDAALVALLDARAEGLGRLAAEQQLQNLIATKDGAGLLPFALRNSWNARLVADWGARALARKSRLMARRVTSMAGRNARWS